MRLRVVAAASLNGVIGRGGGLPWPRLPADLAEFRRLTEGHAVVVGRRTYESLPPRGLPGRDLLVVTRRPRALAAARGSSAFAPPRHGRDGFAAVASLEEACWVAGLWGREPCVAGGEALFARALEVCRDLYLTVVVGDFEGDVRMPEVPARLRLRDTRLRPADAANPYALRFRHYEAEEEAPCSPVT